MIAAPIEHLFIDLDRDSAFPADRTGLEIPVGERVVLPFGPTSQPRYALHDGLAEFPNAKLILQVPTGLPTVAHLRFARTLLRDRRSVWFWFPSDNSAERVDEERIESYFRHRAAQRFGLLATGFGRKSSRVALRGTRKLQRGLDRGNAILERIARRVQPKSGEDAAGSQGVRPSPAVSEYDTIADPRPVPLTEDALRGRGLYLRTDFWAPLSSGGSYGHTCYVAAELAKRSTSFLALLANRFALLDDLGVDQVEIESPFEEWPEDNIVRATAATHSTVRTMVRTHRPDYIYERLVLGNYTGASVAREFEIPYIVEYNGSEISMRRSFDGVGYREEAKYLAAEQAAFAQASLISVISDAVKEDLVERGVDPHKILVNPNGACPENYRPPVEGECAEIRRDLGIPESATVLGFTGTFGGWHGCDVLATVMERVCRELPGVHFLLIGDGNYRHLIDDVVKSRSLESRVHCLGRIAQGEGARALRACDVFLSPHNAHMVDRRFFGSPTKLFEYMATGRAIIASDLEQIGAVLQPALRAADLGATPPVVTNERAILCRPGDADDVVRATSLLIRDPELRERLGSNARRAVESTYSWDRHVERIFEAARGVDVESVRNHALPAANVESISTAHDVVEAVANVEAATTESTPSANRLEDAADERKFEIIAGDEDLKRNAQSQWNNEPCGSHYAKDHPRETLEWYLDVERYRYKEYGPWMADVMEFDQHAGEDVLEIGAGLGTDLAQFAKNGARVTDLDLSAGHLAHARRNFELRGLEGRFIHHDAERLPFADNSFDVVYSCGVLHHIPGTEMVLEEIERILRPGGKTILMFYAENSLHYWRNLFFAYGIRNHELEHMSMGNIMSRTVELGSEDHRPLVKVYTAKRLRNMLADFDSIDVCKRQFMPEEKPRFLRWIPRGVYERTMGWNLIAKATKPAKSRRGARPAREEDGLPVHFDRTATEHSSEISS